MYVRQPGIRERRTIEALGSNVKTSRSFTKQHMDSVKANRLFYVWFTQKRKDGTVRRKFRAAGWIPLEVSTSTCG